VTRPAASCTPSSLPLPSPLSTLLQKHYLETLPRNTTSSLPSTIISIFHFILPSTLSTLSTLYPPLPLLYLETLPWRCGTCLHTGGTNEEVQNNEKCRKTEQKGAKKRPSPCLRIARKLGFFRLHSCFFRGPSPEGRIP
jgi:hypothetical protein